MNKVTLTVSERVGVNVESTTLILVKDGEISALDITVAVVSTVLEGNSGVDTSVSLTVSTALLIDTVSVLGVGMKLDSGIDAVTEVDVNIGIDVISVLLIMVGDISILDMVVTRFDKVVVATRLGDDTSTVLSTMVLVIVKVGVISVLGVNSVLDTKVTTELEAMLIDVDTLSMMDVDVAVGLDVRLSVIVGLTSVVSEVIDDGNDVRLSVIVGLNSVVSGITDEGNDVRLSVIVGLNSVVSGITDEGNDVRLNVIVGLNSVVSEVTDEGSDVRLGTVVELNSVVSEGNADEGISVVIGTADESIGVVFIVGNTDVKEIGVTVETTSELNDEVTEVTKGIVLETSIRVLDMVGAISVLENEVVVKISVLGGMGDSVDTRNGVLGSLNDMIVVFGIISELEEIGGVGDGAILVDAITPVVITVGNIVMIDVGVMVTARLDVVTGVMILSVETKNVDDTITLVESIPRLVAMVNDDIVSIVVGDTRLDISALLEGETKVDCDVTFVILEVTIVGNTVLVTGITLLELVMTEVNNVLVVLETGKLVTITLEVPIGLLKVTSGLEIKIVVETIAEVLDGTTVVNVILVDSLMVIVNDGVINDDVTNDGVILDDSTTLVVVFLTALDVTVKDGVISLVNMLVKAGVTSVLETLLEILLETVLISKVLETTTMLLPVVCVTFMLLVAGKEVSIGMVDEIIGGLDKGDTVLVKDVMEVVSLKLEKVENPLPGGSDVESPLPKSDDGTRLEVIVNALLGVSNNVEASMLVSIPLPISSLLSALFTLMLLYCSHVLSAE